MSDYFTIFAARKKKVSGHLPRSEFPDAQLALFSAAEDEARIPCNLDAVHAALMRVLVSRDLAAQPCMTQNMPKRRQGKYCFENITEGVSETVPTAGMHENVDIVEM